MLYEYSCCGMKFERLISIEMRDQVACLKCGKKAKRIMGNSRHVWVGPPEWAYAWKQGNKFK